MKYLGKSCCVFVLFCALSCTKETGSRINAIERIDLLSCKNPVTSSGQKTTICFDELVEDSRCPEDVYCIWSGIAVGRFSFTANGQTHSFKLSTYTFAIFPPKDTVIGGYKIELIDLLPYPRSQSNPPGYENKVAEVRVSRQ